MVLRIHGKDESVVRFRQGAPSKYLVLDTIRIEDFFFYYIELFEILRLYQNLYLAYFGGKNSGDATLNLPTDYRIPY